MKKNPNHTDLVITKRLETSHEKKATHCTYTTKELDSGLATFSTLSPTDHLLYCFSLSSNVRCTNCIQELCCRFRHNRKPLGGI